MKILNKLNQTKENADNTLLAIRAPKGTTLEVPEPSTIHNHAKQMGIKQEIGEEEFQNQLFLTSPKEEILVYMITNDQGLEDDAES